MSSSSRRDFIRILGSAAIGGAGASFAGCARQANGPQSRKPNFLFILVDDLGWADLAYNGSELYQTPNIDRLAAGGMQFTNGYAACPVCSPTRASIMTGKYPARLHLTNYLPGEHRLPYSSVIPPAIEQQLPHQEVTIAEALREAGYTSGSIGKWHLGSDGYLPTDQGFDYNYAGTASGMPRSFFYPQWAGNPPVEGREGEYLPDHLTDRALEFIERNKDRPFFLYLPFYAVHIPIEGKPEYIEKFRPRVNPGAVPGKDQHNPIYAAMIYSVDENVGRLLDRLDELGLADNTVVVFMSDNGGLTAPEWKNEPVTSNLPLREGKGHLNEGGIREPWLVKWPGVTQPGSRADVPVISNDFFPTILEIAGVDYDYGAHPVDGVSLAAVLKQSGGLPARELFWHYPHYSNQLGRPGGAVRQGDFKLIEFYDDKSVELYHLAEDIGERNNLAKAMPEKAAELKAKFEEWLKSVEAQMPTRNPNYDPKRAQERVRPG